MSLGYDARGSSTTSPLTARAAAVRGYDDARHLLLARPPAASRFLATKAGGGAAQRTVTALTREQDAGLRAALRDPNKFGHVFNNPRHKLDPLVNELGGRDAVLREAVLAVPRSQTGIFEVSKQLGRHNLTVRGRVVNGVPRIGTVFVP
ncbi:MAG: hypothetical protein MSC31_19405 [Solirubrobacteraceae bacterium MAG38_C4-C5]|nr:hypothetical protein [Candidatus Siliceabacter maunaloa]